VSCTTTDCTYTPNLNFNGADSYTYTICDDGTPQLCDTATVSVTINPVNDAPVAGDDVYATDEDTALNVVAPGVLDNDSDVDGDTLGVSEVNGSAASVGQQIALSSGALVTLNANGSFEYDPNGAFENLAVGEQAVDTYTYTVSDGNGGTDTATVSITITGVNDAPVANVDTYGTDENTLLTIPAPGVLVNDSDVDGDALSVSEVNSSPANVGVQITLGSGALLTVGSDGGFTYDPNGQFEYLAAGAMATDWYTYTASDGNGGAATTQVTIRILGINDAPIVVSVDPASQNAQYSDGIVPVTIVATDIDTPALTIPTFDVPAALAFDDPSCVVVGPNGSQCTWQLSGNVAVPAATYTATFTVGDGAGGTASGSADITVEAEDAAIDFDDDNAQAVLVDTPGGDSGPFQLVVHVTERVPDADTDPDGDSLAFPGDIGLAQVSMILTPVGPGSTVSDDCDLRTVSGSGYDAILTVTCDFTGVEVNTYTIEVTVDGDYYSGYSEDVVTIYDPSLGFTTGGGWFYWPGTADPRTGYPGDRTNFGYTMRYNNQGRNLRGSLLVIRHLPDNTIYRVKSNALQGLSLGIETDSGTGETFGWASFTGKATYFEPGWPEPIGNHRFIAYVEDHNEPGTGIDRFWLETRDKQRNVIPVMSMATPAQDNAVPLEGGNIVAPHGDSAQTEAGPDGVILSTSEPDSIFGR
jgi:VCBS repeat-containing protein